MTLKHSQAAWSLSEPLFSTHMSFISGPRQCGKTTMALDYLNSLGLDKERYYFNWDRSDVRKRFKGELDWLSTLKISGQPPSKPRPALVFDEIHKVRHWKRLLKGVYDQYKDDFQFVITGSGRLDHYQRGGDSLAGRFDNYLLFPFTPGEISNTPSSETLTLEKILSVKPLKDSLIAHWEMTGGFPEAFLSASAAKSARWWQQYQLRVTEEDLRDLTRLESVDLMRDLLRILPSKISAPLSLQSIREDLDTSFATVKRYVATLQQLFMLFEVAPYSKKIHRPVKKEKKIYFFHHPAIQDEGARFENMIALLLKRWVSERNEKAEGEYGLNYLRDQDRREVDFLLTKNEKPFFLFEAKLRDTAISNSLRYYSEKLKIPGVQIVRQPSINLRKPENLGVASIHHLAALLG